MCMCIKHDKTLLQYEKKTQKSIAEEKLPFKDQSYFFAVHPAMNAFTFLHANLVKSVVLHVI